MDGHTGNEIGHAHIGYHGDSSLQQHHLELRNSSAAPANKFLTRHGAQPRQTYLLYQREL